MVILEDRNQAQQLNGRQLNEGYQRWHGREPKTAVRGRFAARAGSAEACDSRALPWPAGKYVGYFSRPTLKEKGQKSQNFPKPPISDKSNEIIHMARWLFSSKANKLFRINNAQSRRQSQKAAWNQWVAFCPKPTKANQSHSQSQQWLRISKLSPSETQSKPTPKPPAVGQRAQP